MGFALQSSAFILPIIASYNCICYNVTGYSFLSNPIQVEEISRTMLQIGELLSKSDNSRTHNTSTYNRDIKGSIQPC